MNMFLVNSDNEAARSCMLKLAEQGKPGAIIPLTGEEFKAFTGGDFVEIKNHCDDSGLKLTEIDLSKSYIAVVDNSINLEDIVKLIGKIGADINIIRSRR